VLCVCGAPSPPAIAFDARKGRNVAITSQEDAAVWIGEFDWKVGGCGVCTGLVMLLMPVVVMIDK
jgi:hypothetical protein